MPAITAALSLICGTHFGLTKLVTSIWLTPASCRRCTSSIFCAVVTGAFSFCSPSRGPTSTSVTRDGSMAVLLLARAPRPIGRAPRGNPRSRLCHESEQLAALVDLVPDAVEQFGDGAVARRCDGVLHLHRLHHRERL